MHDDPVLPRFFIRLALVGSPAEVFQQAVPDLQEELDQRDYLLNPRVMWETEAGRVVVEVEDVGRDPQKAADNMAEKLLEIGIAVLGDFEEYRVDILSASPAGRANDAL